MAVALGESMLRGALPAHWVGRTNYYTALSYVQLGRLEKAEAPIKKARQYATGAGDPEMLVECMATDAALATFREAPDATDLARLALNECRKLKQVPRNLELRILNCLASTYLVAGEWAAALAACREALEMLDDPYELRRRAGLLGAAAIACQELGQLDVAIDYARQAVEMETILRDWVSLARSENNLGWMLARQGQTTEGRVHLERSLALTEKTHLEAGRCHVLMSFADLCLAEGDPEGAWESALQALRSAELSGELTSAAKAHMLLGQIAEARSQPDAADSEFKAAIDQFAALRSKELLLRCQQLYAEILDKRGSTAMPI